MASTPKEPKLIPFDEFIAAYKPPEYRIGGLIQRSRFYSLTGITGHGKTAVSMAMAVHEALGKTLANRTVNGGNVIYFAAENPDDARARAILMKDRMNLDAERLPLYFVDGGFNIHDWIDAIRKQAEVLDGNVATCYIDTSPAFQAACGFTDENDNLQAFKFATTLRGLTELPGKPTVMGLTHPIKSANDRDSLIPRGGGAYIAEVDGNFTVWADAEHETTELHWTGKLRGPAFDPITFVLEGGTCNALRDCNGALIPSVWAYPATQARAEAAESRQRENADIVLLIMLEAPDRSLADWARKLGWVTDLGEAQRYRVLRIMRRLKEQNLAREVSGQWQLTKAGKAESERIRARNE